MKRRLSFAELGAILIREFGMAACIQGYATDVPEWIGRQAIVFGDIDWDGTLT